MVAIGLPSLAQKIPGDLEVVPTDRVNWGRAQWDVISFKYGTSATSRLYGKLYHLPFDLAISSRRSDLCNLEMSFNSGRTLKYYLEFGNCN